MKTFEAITRGSRNNTRRDLIIQFTDDWLFHGSARVKRLSILDPCQGMFNRGVEDRVISSLILATTLSVKDGPVLYDTARLSSFHTILILPEKKPISLSLRRVQQDQFLKCSGVCHHLRTFLS